MPEITPKPISMQVELFALKTSRLRTSHPPIFKPAHFLESPPKNKWTITPLDCARRRRCRRLKGTLRTTSSRSSNRDIYFSTWSGTVGKCSRHQESSRTTLTVASTDSSKWASSYPSARLITGQPFRIQQRSSCLPYRIRQPSQSQLTEKPFSISKPDPVRAKCSFSVADTSLPCPEQVQLPLLEPQPAPRTRSAECVRSPAVQKRIETIITLVGNLRALQLQCLHRSERFEKAGRLLQKLGRTVTLSE